MPETAPPRGLVLLGIIRGRTALPDIQKVSPNKLEIKVVLPDPVGPQTTESLPTGKFKLRFLIEALLDPSLLCSQLKVALSIKPMVTPLLAASAFLWSGISTSSSAKNFSTRLTDTLA